MTPRSLYVQFAIKPDSELDDPDTVFLGPSVWHVLFPEINEQDCFVAVDSRFRRGKKSLICRTALNSEVGYVNVRHHPYSRFVIGVQCCHFGALSQKLPCNIRRWQNQHIRGETCNFEECFHYCSVPRGVSGRCILSIAA
jgi:hypothetical protein